VTERTIATTIHGRYLVNPPATPGPAPMLVGFHGYAENAEAQMERLRAIPESAQWLTVSIQALHRFYQRRTDLVVASWMTRQDRELAIADNVAYVNACIDSIAADWPTLSGVMFAGFSQGVAMAYRAAVNAGRDVGGVIAMGGDIPPELTPQELRRLPAVLILRGRSDEWYIKEKLATDERRLRETSVSVRALEFDAGHEWSSGMVEAASVFLRERYEYALSR
jgi:predicted esterase